MRTMQRELQRQFPFLLFSFPLLKHDAYQPVAAFVYHSCYRVAQLHLNIRRQARHLARHAVLNKVIERFSEDVRAPYLIRFVFELVNKVFDKLLALFGGADKRVDLAFDINANDMQSGSLCFQTNTETRTMLDG